MQTHAELDLSRLPGYRWMANGQSVFSGRLRELYAALDAMFVRWADACDADDHLFPAFLPAAELAKVDYLRSFPHLATFACALDPDAQNLARFAAAPAVDERGAVSLGALAPVSDVLTPAACYHVYIGLKGQTLDRPHHATTRCTCFRREAYYAPLRRQSSFGMREIVCVGTADEVKGFLETYRARVERFVQRIDLPIAWEQATDPFFNAAANPKFLAQRLDPVKTEMVYGGELAIGSVNFHRNFFGEAFGIERRRAPAFSGCVAFGFERWVYAVLHRYGVEPAGWPAFAEER